MTLSIETRNSIDFWLDQTMFEIFKWHEAFDFYIESKNKIAEQQEKEAEKKRKNKGR